MAVLVAAFSFATQAQDTWRADDTVGYYAACHDEESTLAVVEASNTPETAQAIWDALSEARRCFYAGRQIGARLMERVSGPHLWQGGPETGYIWRVEDQFGDTEYIFLNAVTGSHPPLEPSRYIPAQAVCGEREDFVKHLSRQYREAPAAMGLVSNGSLLEILVSEKGSWTIIVTRPDGMTCVVAAGDAWEDMPRLAVGADGA